MTTKQALKIGKELLPELPGFTAEGKMVFKLPVDDFLRGLFFENSSNANRFHLHVFFMPLLVPDDYINLSYGKRIGKALNWDLENPNLLADLRAVIQGEAVSFLDNVCSLTGVLDYLRIQIEVDRERVNPRTLEAFAYTLIRKGDYSSAFKALDELNQRFGKSTTPWVMELVARAKSVEEKILAKPEVALAQLEAWKAETMGKLGLERHHNRYDERTDQ